MPVTAKLVWFLAVLSSMAGASSWPASADDDTFRVLSPTGGGSHPAVLLVPGCSGFVANGGVNVYDERATELQVAGYLVVYVDYIGKRMQTNCAHVGQTEVSADILCAAKSAAARSDVDPSRIYVIGWSYGAAAVLAALGAATPDTPITKAIMYYPVCRGARPWSGVTAGMMLLGAADDIALPALCDVVTKGVPDERLKVVSYANARHGFDMRGLSETKAAGAPAYDPEASAASWTAVMEFLK